MSQINFGPDHAVRPRPARIAQDRARIAQDREEGERHRRGSGGSSEDTADRPGNARRVSSRWTRFGSRSHPNRQTPRNLDSRMNAARPPWPAALRRRHRRSENTSTQFVPSSNSWIRPVLRRACQVINRQLERFLAKRMGTTTLETEPRREQHRELPNEPGKPKRDKTIPAVCCRMHERFRRTRAHRFRRFGCGAPRGDRCGQAAGFTPGDRRDTVGGGSRFRALGHRVGHGAMPPEVDPEAALQLDRNRHWHAEDVSRDGAQLARSLGLDAAALAVAGAGGVAETILDLAREQHAAAIVIGSRGLSGPRARLEGSTSTAVSKRASFPVLVVHESRTGDE
jgi:nucleotide-binding universal stress UspA family protein